MEISFTAEKNAISFRLTLSLIGANCWKKAMSKYSINRQKRWRNGSLLIVKVFRWTVEKRAQDGMRLSRYLQAVESIILSSKSRYIPPGEKSKNWLTNSLNL